MNEEIVVLYSGGTDSTCCAALMAGKFSRLHLLSYNRFGLFGINNIKTNVSRLKDKFGENKFIHKDLNIDKLFKKVSYSRYFYNIRNYGFFVLSTCGLCKLTMHLRTLIYCLDEGVKNVCDGSNKNMKFFPGQMKIVIEEIKRMYSEYGINFMTPVYELNHPENLGWAAKTGLSNINIMNEKEVNFKNSSDSCFTTGQMLKNMGIFDSDNLKGTSLDKKMQARCFQLVLFNIFLYGYFLPAYGESLYFKVCLDFYKDKIKYFKHFIDEYVKKGRESRLGVCLF
ncbi:MAG: hypothetical protein GF375_06935 [Candidatus Omnitrophica bacterium]|nr:hypothetical protein [Candidatus Omnitrophota bacterium]MBD3269711.1 hypothetical protein [Candidatus Omnitrophota bacterium]